MITVYGIASCDSCRKARRWLDQHEVRFRFHDLRNDGLDATMLERWSRHVDWNLLLNKRSTTWRSIAERDRRHMERQHAIALMLKYPTLVKRPLLERGNTVMIGFQINDYRRLLG